MGCAVWYFNYLFSSVVSFPEERASKLVKVLSAYSKVYILVNVPQRVHYEHKGVVERLILQEAKPSAIFGLRPRPRAACYNFRRHKHNQDFNWFVAT